MSGRSPQPVLEWPAWLGVLAARDDPPTELDDKLLARMARAGVTELDPADGSTFLDVAEAERATAIGASGPGFGFLEPLTDERAPTGGALERLGSWVERYDRLRTLRLAAIDMELAVSAGRALAETDGPARVFARVLETGLVTTYARPYLTSNRPALGGRWRPESAEDRELHDLVIERMRKPYHAHSGRTPYRTLLDTAWVMGRDGPPIFAEAWQKLTVEQLGQLAELADRQAARLHEAADAIGAELGEERAAPSYPRIGPGAVVSFDHGIEAAARELRELFGERRDVDIEPETSRDPP